MNGFAPCFVEWNIGKLLMRYLLIGMCVQHKFINVILRCRGRKFCLLQLKFTSMLKKMFVIRSWCQVVAIATLSHI